MYIHRNLHLISWSTKPCCAICGPQITNPHSEVFCKQQVLLLPCIVGADIAAVMLDFIDWLTHQEFGRRCVVSIRDILSWVNFMNTMGEEAALKRPETISTVTSFVHAACLVYIDGIGSGMSVVCQLEGTGDQGRGKYTMGQAQTSDPDTLQNHSNISGTQNGFLFLCTLFERWLV